MTAIQHPDHVTFDFVRSPFFRVVHSNGAWGGITPRQELSVTFYSERFSLPSQVTHAVLSDGLGAEISRDSTKNIQRECEVEVLMSMTEAINLHKWIGAKIEEWRKIGIGFSSDDAREVSL